MLQDIDFRLLLIYLVSFFIAAIPFGKIVVWNAKKIDLQDFGSKNVGTTNAYRAAGLQWASLVFFLDFLKGFLPPLVTWIVFQNSNYSLVASFIAILGSVFSPYLKFKGGKGAATATGSSFFHFHILALISFFFWLIVLKLTKKMSIATFSGLIMCVLLVFLLRETADKIFIISLAILVLYTHRENIQRLLAGKELEFKKSPQKNSFDEVRKKN